MPRVHIESSEFTSITSRCQPLHIIIYDSWLLLLINYWISMNSTDHLQRNKSCSEKVLVGDTIHSWTACLWGWTPSRVQNSNPIVFISDGWKLFSFSSSNYGVYTSFPPPTIFRRNSGQVQCQTVKCWSWKEVAVDDAQTFPVYHWDTHHPRYPSPRISGLLTGLLAEWKGISSPTRPPRCHWQCLMFDFSGSHLTLELILVVVCSCGEPDNCTHFSVHSGYLRSNSLKHFRAVAV